MATSAVLKEINLTTREVLSNKASDRKANELEKQDERVIEELANRNEELESELEAAKAAIGRLAEAGQGYKSSQGTKCGTAFRSKKPEELEWKEKVEYV